MNIKNSIKRSIIHITGVMILCGMVACKERYILFRPFVFNTEKDQFEYVERDKAFYQRLALIFKLEGKDFKLDDSGRVLVKSGFGSNEDMLLTYTTNAKDSAWIKTLLETEEINKALNSGVKSKK